jgi:hypothetical protein
MPEDMSDKMSDGILKNIPNRMLKGMSDRIAR